MLKGNKTLLVLVSVFLAVFIYGVGRLFLLRFETGDVYPAYSSLRVDPLGTKAFYDSLENFRQISVSRNYRPLPKLHEGLEATIFYLGARVKDLGFVHEDLLKAFDALVATGGRLIISFYPIRERASVRSRGECPGSAHAKEAEEKGETDRNGPERSLKKAEEPKGSESTSQGSRKRNERSDHRDFERERCKFVSLADHWGVRFGFDERLKDARDDGKAWKALNGKLPNFISWHTVLYFDGLPKPWRVIYVRDGHPVIMERRFGRGTIVLSADSYFFSNEALRVERHPGLLAWLVGRHTNVVFDETHLGVRENPGIASFARKYDLHGLFLGIVLLVGLFVWKNSLHFIPPPELPSTGGSDFNSERDYTAGFVSLLRRNIPPRDILRICFQEWKKSLPPSRRDSCDKQDRAGGVIDAQGGRPAKQRNPVEGYQTIQRILAERK